MIDQKVYPHPQLPPPQQMHPNLMNQRPPNHQMMPHPPHPHPHAQYQQQQQTQQQQQSQMQHQQQQGPHSVRPNMIRMQNTMPMQPMHQPSGPVKPNVHNSMPSNAPFNNNSSNNNGSNNSTSNNNNDPTGSAAAAAAAAANSHVFANGSHGSNNQANNTWKQEQPHCSGCKKPIYERHLLKALDQLWHEDCLKCTACHARLGEVGNTLYHKANLLLCKSDYYRMFGTPGICSACSQRILRKLIILLFLGPLSNCCYLSFSLL